MKQSRRFIGDTTQHSDHRAHERNEMKFQPSVFWKHTTYNNFKREQFEREFGSLAWRIYVCIQITAVNFIDDA